MTVLRDAKGRFVLEAGVTAVRPIFSRSVRAIVVSRPLTCSTDVARRPRCQPRRGGSSGRGRGVGEAPSTNSMCPANRYRLIRFPSLLPALRETPSYWAVDIYEVTGAGPARTTDPCHTPHVARDRPAPLPAQAFSRGVSATDRPQRATGPSSGRPDVRPPAVDDRPTNRGPICHDSDRPSSRVARQPGDRPARRSK